jgi:hypothetical protein
MLRVLTGAALPTTLRALVIVQGDDAVPDVRVDAGAVTARVFVRAPIVSHELAVELSSRKVHVWNVLVQFEGASGGDLPFTLLASAGDEKRTLRLRTLPAQLPSEGLGVIVASCYFAGFKQDVALRAALAAPYLGVRTTFQLWVGDNVYVDVPAFSGADPPYAQTLDRYLSYFVQSDYSDARNQHSNFTIYDDHEFWNDFPASQPWLSRTHGARTKAAYTRAARECARLFQADLNPPVAAPEAQHGLSYQFAIAPVSFFVADTRSERLLAPDSPRLMHPNDLRALQTWARTLTGPGVLVIGQPLWVDGVDHTLILITADHNPPYFGEDFRAIWAALRSAPYDVLIVTGDIHYSRLLKFSFANAPERAVFEYVSSPACHIPHSLGSSQDRGSVEMPTQLTTSGQRVQAQYLMGTDAPNSFGVLSLRPTAGNGVEVGLGFIEYEPRRGAHYASNVNFPKLPKFGPAYTQCREARAFTLRMR